MDALRKSHVWHFLDLEKRISLSVGDLEGNIFVVNVVMGLMEIAAVTVLMFNLDRLRKISRNIQCKTLTALDDAKKSWNRISRHKITAGTFIGSGVCYLICGLLDVYGTSESAALASTAFALIGKFFTSGKSVTTTIGTSNRLWRRSLDKRLTF